MIKEAQTSEKSPPHPHRIINARRSTFISAVFQGYCTKTNIVLFGSGVLTRTNATFARNHTYDSTPTDYTALEEIGYEVTFNLRGVIKKKKGGRFKGRSRAQEGCLNTNSTRISSLYYTRMLNVPFNIIMYIQCTRVRVHSRAVDPLRSRPADTCVTCPRTRRILTFCQFVYRSIRSWIV